MYYNKLVNFIILMPGLEKYFEVQKNNVKNTPDLIVFYS